MAAPRKQNQWASQAAQAALLRYAPQREGLAQLTREAREQYDASIKGAQSTSRLASAAVDQAAPQVSGIYDRAAATTSASQSKLGQLLAGLGSAAAPFAAAAITQAAAGTDKLARERATTETGLAQQKVSAKEAPVFARTLATQQLAKSLAKIFSAEQGINTQQGAAAATERAKLENEAEGRRVTERGQDKTAQSSREGHKLTAAAQVQKAQEHQEDLALKRAEGAGTGGGKPLTPHEQNEGAATIRQIAQYAKSISGNRAARVAALTEGEPGVSTSYKAGEKGPDGKPIEHNTSVSTKSVPSFKPDVLMSAALDLAEHKGHVTRATAHRLQQSGYNIQRLGLPVLSGTSERTSKGARETGAKIKSAIGF
jgi:hypothetical protein